MLTITTNLPFLAREINDAHRQVKFHARGMLLEAKRAGEALIEAKKQCPHGTFKTWVEAHCSFSYTSAREYMQVAKHAKMTDLRHFEGGVRAFLDAYANPNKKPKPSPFGHAEAEYAMKLHRMAESTANENEAEVAQKKLDKFAADHGMNREEVVEKSRKKLDLEWQEQKQSMGTTASAVVKVIEKKFATKSKDDLIQIILKMVMDHPETLSTLKDHLHA